MRGVKPFVGIKNDEVISRIEMGERLPLPAEAPAPLFGLMNRCWSYEPEKRPDFSLVEATIANVMEEERQLASLTSRRLAPPDLAPQKPPYRPHSSQSFVQVYTGFLCGSVTYMHVSSLSIPPSLPPSLPPSPAVSQARRNSGVSDEENSQRRMSGDDVSHTPHHTSLTTHPSAHPSPHTSHHTPLTHLLCDGIVVSPSFWPNNLCMYNVRVHVQ